MGKCDACGNDYERSFEVTMEGRRFVFDCFECAIDKLAPSCESCGVQIIGHGLEQQGSMFCCASCARRAGATALRDNA